MFPKEIEAQISKWRTLGLEPHAIPITHPDGVCYVVFRTLTKLEFTIEKSRVISDNITGALNPEIYQNLIELCVLYPTPLPDYLPAACDNIIYNAILEASGWESTDKLISEVNKQREEAATLDYFIKAKILSVFPNIEPNSFNNMRLPDIIHLAILAENISGTPIDFEPWLNPEAYAAKMEKEKKRQQRDTVAAHELTTASLMNDPEYRNRMMRRATKL